MTHTPSFLVCLILEIMSVFNLFESACFSKDVSACFCEKCGYSFEMSCILKWCVLVLVCVDDICVYLERVCQNLSTFRRSKLLLIINTERQYLLNILALFQIRVSSI